jgi:hypothetical protein
MTDAVKIEGLREFRLGLRDLNADLPKALRLAFNDAADLIVSDARPKVASRTGRAASTVKARSTQTSARVVGGGNRAPYYPWLDFGGRIPRGPSRPFLPKGRYIYAAFFRRRDEFTDRLQDRLVEVAHAAGIEVT